MNSLDRELLEDAGVLLTRVMGGETEITGEINNWLARAARAGIQPSSAKSGTTDTRWRPIDKDANVAAEPAPEPPDDPDEGETGPPEQQG